MEATVPAAWTPRSAPFEGPGGSLQRLDGPGGAVGLAIRVRPDLADHPAVQRGMDEVAGFVRGPGVPGVLPLAAWDRDRAVFVYEIGDGRLLSELLADCAARRIVPGERVGVELVWRVASVLDAAARAGGPVGVFNHGNLSPWRIVVYPDGDIALLGYALPPVEVFAWLDGGTDEPPGAALRYCPLERIQDDNEDVRSDLFSLGVIAAELALGGPLLSGTASELVDKIMADESAAAIEILSGPVRSLLQGTLALTRADRRRTGAEVAREARMVLRSMGGRTLSALARGAWDERVDPEIAPGMTPIRAEPRFVVIERADKPIDPAPIEVEEPTPREWRTPPSTSEARSSPTRSEPDRSSASGLREPERTQPIEGPAPADDREAEAVPVESEDGREAAPPGEAVLVGEREGAPEAGESVLVEGEGEDGTGEAVLVDDPDPLDAPGPRLEPVGASGGPRTPELAASAAGRIAIPVPRIGSTRGVVDAADEATVLFERGRPVVDDDDDEETDVGPVQDWVYEMGDPAAPEPGLGLEEDTTTLHDHLEPEPEEVAEPEPVEPHEALGAAEDPDPIEADDPLEAEGSATVAEPEDREPAPEDPEPLAASEDLEPVAAPEDPEPVAAPEDPEPVAAPDDPEPVAAPDDPEPVAAPEGPDRTPATEDPEPPPGEAVGEARFEPLGTSRGREPTAAPEHPEPIAASDARVGDAPDGPDPEPAPEEPVGEATFEPLGPTRKQARTIGAPAARARGQASEAPPVDPPPVDPPREGREPVRPPVEARGEPALEPLPARKNGDREAVAARREPVEEGQDPGPLPEELPTLFDPGPVARELPPDPPPVVMGSPADPLDPPPPPKMEVVAPAPAPKTTRSRSSKPPRKPSAEPPPEALRPPEIPDVLHLRGVTVDLADREVRAGEGAFSKLNANQVAVLGYLAARPGRDVRRDEIWKHALNGQGSRSSVRGMVARLRKKIERNAAKPEHLINVPGVGFRFVLPDGFTAPKGAKLPEPDGPPTGREVELDQVVSALDYAPVVSIVGPPGSGTRQLALHAAHAAVKQGREVHRCSLGAESLTATLARDLGVRRLGRTEDEIHADLAAVLVARPDLLIFIDAPSPDPTLREMVGRWLERSPEARFLIACRGALGLPGEKCIRLEALREQAAIERFLKRAKSRPIKQLDAFSPRPEAQDEDPEAGDGGASEDAAAEEVDAAEAGGAAGGAAEGVDRGAAARGATRGAEGEAERAEGAAAERAEGAAAEGTAAEGAEAHRAGGAARAEADRAEADHPEADRADPSRSEVDGADAHRSEADRVDAHRSDAALADAARAAPAGAEEARAAGPTRDAAGAEGAETEPGAGPAAEASPEARGAPGTAEERGEPGAPDAASAAGTPAPAPPAEAPPPKPEDGLDPVIVAAIHGLDPIERSALEQLVVFRDGFDLGSSEAIVELGAVSRSMMTIVESLIARDLAHIVADNDSANVRWNLFDDVRTYLRRKVAPEVFEPPQQRHSATYGQLGFRLGGRPWVERGDLAILVRERENLRAALQQGGVLAAGAALGLTAILGYEQAVPLAEAVDRILADPALAHAQAAPWRAGARIASARLRKHLGIPHKASAELRAAVGDLQSHDQMLLVEVARLHTELGSTFEAEAALNRVATGDPWLLAVMAMLRGRAKAARAEPKRAERSFVEALHGFSVLQADIGRAHAQRHFAEVLGGVSRGGRAIALLQQAMEVFEDVRDLPNATLCRMRLAELLIGSGEGDKAAPHLERVLDFARDTAAQGLLALARGVLGVVRTLEHQWEEAEQLFFLALAGSAPEHKRIQSLFALHLLLRGDPDTAHEEAQGALPDPVATALVAALERQPAPEDDEAFLLFEALEAWRAAASLSRVESALADRSSVAVRMVLACPRQRPQRVAAPGR